MSTIEDRIKEMLKPELERRFGTTIVISKIQLANATRKRRNYRLDVSYQLEGTPRTETLNVTTYAEYPETPYKINGELTEDGRRIDEDKRKHGEITDEDFDQNMS